jgi:hypothetical protein
MNAYTPQPGTIPHRAIAHLQSLDKGAELATAVLCEEIGAQPNGFHACMLPAQRQGLVKTVKKLRISYWSLGDGRPVVHAPDLEPEEGAEPDALMPTRPTTAEALLSAWVRPNQVDPVGPEELADALASSSAVPENKPEASMAATDLEHPALVVTAEMFQPEDEPFVCALWSDGRLQLQRGGDELALLDLDETRSLLRYLKWTGALDTVLNALRAERPAQ